MSGDRALDERVHVEVMGKTMNCPLDERGQTGGCLHIPRYSDRIDSAYRVMYAVLKRPFPVPIRFYDDLLRQLRWVGKPDSLARWLQAGSHPLMICRAALTAVQGAQSAAAMEGDGL